MGQNKHMASENKMILEDHFISHLIHSRHVQFYLEICTTLISHSFSWLWIILLQKAPFEKSAKASETEDQNFADFSFLTTITITGVSTLVNGISLDDFLFSVGKAFHPPKRTQLSKHAQVSAVRQKLLEIRSRF